MDVNTPMCKFAQLYACHELFRKYTGVKAQFLCQMMLLSFISNTTGCYFDRTVYPSENKDMDVNMKNIFIVYFPT
jgi:hypothetical protein